MFKIGVLASGGGTNLQAIIDSIKNKYLNIQLAVVISNNENAFALTRAAGFSVPTKVIKSKNKGNESFDQDLIDTLKQYEVDLVVTAGFMVVIPESVINEYENRIINVHPSLIPSFCGTGYYGLAVHEKVLEKGVKLTGATVHFVDGGTDTGPIILQKAVEVLDDDTAKTLQKRVMEKAEWVLLPRAIKLIAEGRVIVENKRVRIQNN